MADSFLFRTEHWLAWSAGGDSEIAALATSMKSDVLSGMAPSDVRAKYVKGNMREVEVTLAWLMIEMQAV